MLQFHSFENENQSVSRFLSEIGTNFTLNELTISIFHSRKSSRRLSLMWLFARVAWQTKQVVFTLYTIDYNYFFTLKCMTLQTFGYEVKTLWRNISIRRIVWLFKSISVFCHGNLNVRSVNALQIKFSFKDTSSCVDTAAPDFQVKCIN